MLANRKNYEHIIRQIIERSRHFNHSTSKRFEVVYRKTITILLTENENSKDMFKDFKEFKQFMIFCHTHYELNDVWHFENGDKGILFEGAWNNSGGNQKYSPFNLPEEQQPQYAKRNSLEEVYEVWQKVRANLVK